MQISLATVKKFGKKTSLYFNGSLKENFLEVKRENVVTVVFLARGKCK